MADDEWLGKLRRDLIDKHERAKYLERLAHPGNNAKATSAGSIAELIAPTYGMKRNRNATRPHSGALGSPSIQATVPVAMPYARLINEKSNR